MKPLWIELVNNGVGNRFEFDDHELIEMNWRLTMYPELYHRVLKHELGHDDDKNRFSDFFHDMKSRTPGLFKFMLHHVSSWTQLLPLYWDRKRHKLVYDLSCISSWIMIFGIAIGLFYLLRWSP